MTEFFLAITCILLVVLLIFLWRRGAIDKSKAKAELQDLADDTRKQFGKWRDELDRK